MAVSKGESIEIICVPTEAGTHFAGQCKAPEAVVTSGGLAEKLQMAGYEVTTHDQVISDDHTARAAAWAPSPKIDGVRNEANTITVMKALQEYLRQYSDRLRDSFAIIVGGDCSITPAVLSGLSNGHPPGTRIGLLYIDGDADLTLPWQTEADGSSGIVDSMTISHLTGRTGGLESMKAFAHTNGKPLITPDNIVLFGFDPLQPATEHWVYLLENRFKAYTRPTVQSDPVRYAKEALSWLDARVDIVYVHFDVDVIDSGEFPLANYPHYAGLSVGQAMAALEEVLRSKKVQGLTITEINPNNDPLGIMVNQVVEGVVQGMKYRKI